MDAYMQQGMKGRHSGSFLSFIVGRSEGEIKVGSIRLQVGSIRSRQNEQRKHI
jgi:hypothetical protein